MKPRNWKWMPVVSLIAALAVPIGTAAQNNSSQNRTPKHHIYKLIDLGTLGGPNAGINGPLVPSMSNSGMYAGQAETATPDPFPYCNPDCLVQHAMKWQNGAVTDLGTLPGTALSSGVSWVSGNGNIAVNSYNGLIDPLPGDTGESGSGLDQEQYHARPRNAAGRTRELRGRDQ